MWNNTIGFMACFDVDLFGLNSDSWWYLGWTQAGVCWFPSGGFFEQHVRMELPSSDSSLCAGCRAAKGGCRVHLPSSLLALFSQERLLPDRPFLLLSQGSVLNPVRIQSAFCYGLPSLEGFAPLRDQ